MAGRFRASRQWAYERAPAIVLANLAFALVCAWTRIVPGFLLYMLAATTAIASAAVSTMHSWRIFATEEQLGFRRYRDALWYDMAGKGLPDGYYGLLIAVFVALFLTGFWIPAVAVAAASGFLASAWAEAKRKWPGDPPTN